SIQQDKKVIKGLVKNPVKRLPDRQIHDPVHQEIDEVQKDAGKCEGNEDAKADAVQIGADEPAYRNEKEHNHPRYDYRIKKKKEPRARELLARIDAAGAEK